eukprot:366527-Chlamydomonas_euryale.AAC.8
MPSKQTTATRTADARNSHSNIKNVLHPNPCADAVTVALAFRDATISQSSAATSQSLQRAPRTRPGPGSVAMPGCRSHTRTATSQYQPLPLRQALDRACNACKSVGKHQTTQPPSLPPPPPHTSPCKQALAQPHGQHSLGASSPTPAARSRGLAAQIAAMSAGLPSLKEPSGALRAARERQMGGRRRARGATRRGCMGCRRRRHGHSRASETAPQQPARRRHGCRTVPPAPAGSQARGRPARAAHLYSSARGRKKEVAEGRGRRVSAGKVEGGGGRGSWRVTVTRPRALRRWVEIFTAATGRADSVDTTVTQRITRNKRFRPHCGTLRPHHVRTVEIGCGRLSQQPLAHPSPPPLLLHTARVNKFAAHTAQEREALQAQSPLACPNRAESHTIGLTCMKTKATAHRLGLGHPAAGLAAQEERSNTQSVKHKEGGHARACVSPCTVVGRPDARGLQRAPRRQPAHAHPYTHTHTDTHIHASATALLNTFLLPSERRMGWRI